MDRAIVALSNLAVMTEIVSAYVANNSIESSQLPQLMHLVYASLGTLGAMRPPVARLDEPLISARKSITPDFLISLEDGRPYKSLKRHLARRGLTPQQYRHKWGLPYDYPMVAPNYAKRRSELARQIGLGSQARRMLMAASAPAGDKPSQGDALQALAPRRGPLRGEPPRD